MNWSAHQKRWGNCQLCPLAKTRKNVVLARFSKSLPPGPREVCFVGEAPGRSEDLLGECFVGPSGKVLDCLIEDLGLTSFAILNVIACYPLDISRDGWHFRKPKHEEVEACSPRLLEAVSVILPKRIILLGAVAGAKDFGAPTAQIYHPSYIGRWDGFTSDWASRRQSNVQYKKALRLAKLFLKGGRCDTD